MTPLRILRTGCARLSICRNLQRLGYGTSVSEGADSQTKRAERRYYVICPRSFTFQIFESTLLAIARRYKLKSLLVWQADEQICRTYETENGWNYNVTYAIGCEAAVRLTEPDDAARERLLSFGCDQARAEENDLHLLAERTAAEIKRRLSVRSFPGVPFLCQFHAPAESPTHFLSRRGQQDRRAAPSYRDAATAPGV